MQAFETVQVENADVGVRSCEALALDFVGVQAGFERDHDAELPVRPALPGREIGFGFVESGVWGKDWHRAFVQGKVEMLDESIVFRGAALGVEAVSPAVG
ncbi:MAG: hypothetical protein QOJ99_5730 [Bryobacterales bacterium]|nr:hypothetical protein [Bryobacterales bacterium]